MWLKELQQNLSAVFRKHWSIEFNIDGKESVGTDMEYTMNLL